MVDVRKSQLEVEWYLLPHVKSQCVGYVQQD